MSVIPRIAIVGGGPAGSIAALTLSRAGFAAIVFERATASDDTVFTIGEALPPAAKPVLQRLDLWQDFVSDGHLPCHGNASAWGSPEVSSRDFLRDPYGHGWHLDRVRFDRRLQQSAAGQGADIHRGAAVLDIRRMSRGFQLACRRNGQTARVEVDAVIDATGRASRIARSLGAVRCVQHSMIAVFSRWRALAHDRDSRTIIEAAPEGWWYTALLPNGERVVAYLTDVDCRSGRVARDPEGHRALLSLTRHVRTHTLDVNSTMLGRPATTSAGGARLAHASGQGWAAVGDAAVAFDPLSSQGLLTAIETGHGAAQGLAAYLSTGRGEALADYAARVDRIYSSYLVQHSRHYALERRWPKTTFWRRRQASPSNGSSESA